MGSHPHTRRLHQRPRQPVAHTPHPVCDKQNCLYSKDVVKYARRKGWFKGKDEDFSFCQAYAVSDYLAYRGCDGRVWAYFNRFADGMDRYLPWVTEMKGDALPLYVKPTKKLSVRDLQEMMRDHFDGTPMDMRKEPAPATGTRPCAMRRSRGHRIRWNICTNVR